MIKFAPVLILLLIALFAQDQATAQDARYSIPYSNLLSMNPSLAGANQNLRVGLQYRNQWGSLEKGYTSYAVNALYPYIIGKGSEALSGDGQDQSTENTVNNKLDFGLGFQYHIAGAFKTMDIALSVGYTLRVAENHYLSTAIFGSLIQKSLDASGLTFDDQYVLGSFDASNPSHELILDEKVLYPSLGAGVSWFYNDPAAKLNSYIGISAYNLNLPNESFTGAKGILPHRYSMQAGLKIKGGNRVDVTPNVIYTIQKSSQLLACGVYLDLKFNEKAKIVLGTWYKVGDAATFMAGFDYEYFTVGYAYDLVTSGITRCISGLNTHSVILSFKLDQSKYKGLHINDPVTYF